MQNVIIYICSTLLTYIMGVISKKYNWSMPIPIQNIVVGIGCFLGAIIANYIFIHDNLDAQLLTEQIIVALGGAGTATLGYDTSKISKE